MPFFSIIIPLFNKENYIENTIQSIFNQDFTDYEIIIVDDCSTDKSLAIVKNFSNVRITIIEHNQNKGLSASRNTGIKNASANYIAFLDADDIWKPYFLSEIYALIENYPKASIFGTNYEEVHSHNLSLDIKKSNFLTTQKNYIIDDFYSANLQQPIYCYSSVVFKKEVFEKAGYFDENITFGEDVDFNIRVNFEHQLAYSNRICASYTVFSQNQITNSSIIGKKITDFNKYEHYKKSRPEVKKYLDFNRYIMAMQYKMVGKYDVFKTLKNQISIRNITCKQYLFLQLPKSIVKILKQIKQILLKKGIRVTTYD